MSKQLTLLPTKPRVKTSPMAAATSPERWGVAIVDIVFGVPRRRRLQTVVMAGDTVLHKGSLYTFQGRIDNQLWLVCPGDQVAVDIGGERCS